MNTLQKVTLVFLTFLVSNSFAQIKVDAEIRPRSEYRHGFKTLFPDNTKAAYFTSQRTRLNLNYKIDNLDFYISFQDIRVWGDVPQLNSADNNGMSLHQAWAKFDLNSNLDLKLGRQEIVYDDSRIFGNVGWAQQARSHDIAVFKYQKDAFKMDVGLAFNQSKENLTGTNLTTPKTYKALQYVWVHKSWETFSGSLLFLNNGLQSTNGINYSQTLGTHLKTKRKGINYSANLYYQFGKDVNNKDISAYLLGLESNFKATSTTKLGLGVELQSGNDYNVSATENNAFTPFYGTNHKFNGFMDYFYVGNHMNNVGLVNFYAKANFKLSEKASLTTFLHNFSAAADINATASKQLGNEIDFVYNYNLSKLVNVKAGYSHLFASDSMKFLKGNFDNTNNWAWVMVTIKPTLLKQ
jgi:hypothetical protein